MMIFVIPGREPFASEPGIQTHGMRFRIPGSSPTGRALRGPLATPRNDGILNSTVTNLN
jgi:hypothetical protein